MSLLSLSDLSLQHHLLPRSRRLEKACQHILAAYTFEEPVHVRHTRAASTINRVVHALRPLKRICIWSLVGLALVERPVWCIREYHDGTYPCETELYQGWGHSYLNLRTAFSIEAMCLLFLCMLESGHVYAGGWSYWKPPRNWLKLPLLSFAVVDMIIAMATPATFPRYGPFLRIAIAANNSPAVRRELGLFVRIIPGLFTVVLFTLLNLIFFAFFGLVLFHEVDGSDHYFGTFGKAVWQLWVLQTTCNFPDIMIAPYEKTRWSFIFFFIFVVLGGFFLMNLFTAAVYTKYQDCQSLYEDGALEMTKRHLEAAFLYLDTDESGWLSRDEILALVAELRKAHLLPDVMPSNQASMLLFAALDAEGNNKISKQEFMQLCTVLKVQWEEEDKHTYLERHYPNLYKSEVFQRIRTAVLSDLFQHGCDVTVLLMCVVTVWQTLDQMYYSGKANPAWSDGRIDSVWEVVQTFFTVFFVFEVFLKVLVYGWPTYWRDTINRLEFVTALSCVMMTIAVYLPNNFDDSRWIRATVFLRLLRMFRLLRVLQLPNMLRFLYVIVSIQHVRVFCDTFLSMLPAARRLAKVMFCIVYSYAAAGQMLFGGLVNKDPDRGTYHILKDMDYGKSNYWLLNMNDLPSGMVLMFQLLVVNNWMYFVEAYAAVAGWKAWVFFISFYCIGVIAGLNVLVSFVLDAFVDAMETEKNEEAKDDDDEIQTGLTGPNRFAVIDGSELTGTNTGLAGRWRARIKGYESSSKKADMLLRVLQRMPNSSRFMTAPSGENPPRERETNGTSESTSRYSGLTRFSPFVDGPEAGPGSERN